MSAYLDLKNEKLLHKNTGKDSEELIILLKLQTYLNNERLLFVFIVECIHSCKFWKIVVMQIFIRKRLITCFEVGSWSLICICKKKLFFCKKKKIYYFKTIFWIIDCLNQPWTNCNQNYSIAKNNFFRIQNQFLDLQMVLVNRIHIFLKNKCFLDQPCNLLSTK
jgi:hypothetical protein